VRETVHSLLLPLTLLALPAQADELPAGDTVTEAVVVDLTGSGLDAMADFVPALVPGDIALDPVSDGYSGLYGYCYLGGWGYALSDAWVSVEVVDAALTPGDDVLGLEAELSVHINDASDPFALDLEFECGDTNCVGYVEPFTTLVETTVELDIIDVDGVPTLDATVGALDLDYSDLDGSDIVLDDCAVGTAETILNYIGVSMYDLILDQAGDAIDDAVADLGPEIEEALEDAFSSANINEDVEVGETVMHVELYPSTVDIDPSGLRLTMAGSMAVDDVADCVADWDPGSSTYVDGPVPDPGDWPSSITDPHVVALLSDDIGNQALYGLWRGGLLCYEITEELTGFPLDTSILGLLAGEAFDALFEESASLEIATRPVVAPTLGFTGEHDVDVLIDELGLDFVAELDHRSTRVLALDLDGAVGVDLTLDEATGTLAVGVDLDGESLQPTVRHNEFAPEANADIEENFAGVFDTLVSGVVSGLVGDLSFNLPSFEGLGLTALDAEGHGNESDWLGVYTEVGPVSYEGGCDDEGGCESGCAAGGRAPGRVLLLVLPLALMGLRRRP